MRNSTLEGRDRATLAFPANAQIQITGTVTSVTPLFGAAMAWYLSPVASDTVQPYQTATVNKTWTNVGDARELEVIFTEQAGFTIDYDWDLQISATGTGCPPAHPEACAKAGGNAFFEEELVHDGKHYQGCYEFDSCVSQAGTDLSSTECDEDDPLVDILRDHGGFVAMFAGAVVALPAIPVPAITTPFGAAVVATVIWVVIGGVVVAIVVNYSGDQIRNILAEDVNAIEAASTRVESKVKLSNPSQQDDPEWPKIVRLAVGTCMAHMVLGQVASNITNLDLPEGSVVDFATGFVDVPGVGQQHLCELLKIYMPGGSTNANGVPITEATLHIRDVLYNESNGTDADVNYTGTTPLADRPKPQWSVLQAAPHPAHTTDRDWRYWSPEFACQGSLAQGTGCDEWPWFATTQRGPGENRTTGAHLRISMANTTL